MDLVNCIVNVDFILDYNIPPISQRKNYSGKERIANIKGNTITNVA